MVCAPASPGATMRSALAVIRAKGPHEIIVAVPVSAPEHLEEIGDLVAFLASDRAAYVNAANIRIDGGAADCAV